MDSNKAKFLVRLERFSPLVHGASRLAQIAEEADVIFTPLSLRLVASNRSTGFVATLQLTHHCFAAYSVDNDHYTRLSLDSLHDAMLDCTFCSSITFHLFHKINLLFLRFQNPNNDQQFRRELRLFPHREKDLEEIEYAKFFSIGARDLRHVIRELPLFRDDPVCVIATDSQIKFSIGSKEIVFEGSQCEIVGLETEDETRIKITLKPMLFFLTLTYEVYKVFFYRTMLKSHSVMIFPAFGFQAQYMIYFPQI